MSHYGDYIAGNIIYVFDTTYVNYVPTDLAGSPAVSVYKDDGTTESTAGVTFTAPFDSRTGLWCLKIDTSADGTFYANGHSFHAVLTTGTLGGVSQVNSVLGSFTLGRVQTGDTFARLGAPVGASISADIAEIEAETDDIAAIKTQTDKFAFTVTNQVDANIQSVNDVTVNGNGGTTPWGP